jgi:prepilin-type N-terminal cleavage/methylation domain-containing protein
VTFSCRTGQIRGISCGYTLVELLVALTIASTLLLAMGSILIVSTRAIPNGNSRSASVLAGSRALSSISSDVYYATTITEMTPTSITFTVPDRIGTGQPQAVRYGWSGNPGDPLTRQFNGGNIVNVLSSVQSFALTYDKGAVVAPTTYSTSAETLLASYVTSSGLANFGMASGAWPGQYISPSLPSGTASWSVTRVMLQAEVNGTNTGQSLVQLRAVDASGHPTSTILDQQTLLESSLTNSYTWQTFTFANATGLSPSQSIAVVVQWVSDTYSCNIQYQGAGLLGLGGIVGSLLGTGNMVQWNGSAWSSVAGCNLNFYLYGTYTTPNPTSYNYYLKDVRCSLQTLGDPSTQSSTLIRVISEPQISGP